MQSSAAGDETCLHRRVDLAQSDYPNLESCLASLLSRQVFGSPTEVAIFKAGAAMFLCCILMQHVEHHNHDHSIVHIAAYGISRHISFFSRLGLGLGEAVQEQAGRVYRYLVKSPVIEGCNKQ